jgi:hypothetical protein
VSDQEVGGYCLAYEPLGLASSSSAGLVSVAEVGAYVTSFVELQAYENIAGHLERQNEVH